MFIAEIDVDGVLANMDGGYKPYIQHLIPDFTEKKYIDGWGMQGIRDASPEAWEIVKSLWVNPDFIRNLPRFPGVIEGLKLLAQYPELKCKIHTHILASGDVAKARYEWVEALSEETGCELDIDVCVGKHKTIYTGSDFIVEDNVNNLNASDAKQKFLVRRCHNRRFTTKDIDGKAIIVPNFFHAAMRIAQVIDKQREETA